MQELLTPTNCIDYLHSMSFTNVLFANQENESLYFFVTDENDNRTEAVFQPIEYDRICVSVLENEKWIILEILED